MSGVLRVAVSSRPERKGRQFRGFSLTTCTGGDFNVCDNGRRGIGLCVRGRLTNIVMSHFKGSIVVEPISGARFATLMSITIDERFVR